MHERKVYPPGTRTHEVAQRSIRPDKLNRRGLIQNINRRITAIEAEIGAPLIDTFRLHASNPPTNGELQFYNAVLRDVQRRLKDNPDPKSQS